MPDQPSMRPKPDGTDLGPELVEDVKDFVREIEAERAKRGDVAPKDVFGVTSLLPRRVLAIGFNLLLVAVASMVTFIVTAQKAKNDQDGAAIRHLQTDVIPVMRGGIASLEVRVAGLEGSEGRFDRQLEDLRKEVRATSAMVQDMRAAVARIEVKVDRLR